MLEMVVDDFGLDQETWAPIDALDSFVPLDDDGDLGDAGSGSAVGGS
jgi:hypothetical protein